MWVYAITFVRANVDGAVQMYMSPISFRVKHIDTRGPDLVHHWDGDGLLIASLPTKNLESVRVTTYLIRDLKKLRKLGKFLNKVFSNDGDGVQLAQSIGGAVAAATGPGGLITGAVVKLSSSLASFIGKALMQVEDTVKVYGDGTVIFDEESDYHDAVRKWSVNKSDKGYFTTSWDFLNTHDPDAAVQMLTLPPGLAKRFCTGSPG